jgi:hypothetical protein
MKRLIILISIIALAVIIYPKVDRYFKQRPIKEADLLRNEIVASIKNPFIQADTLILETSWKFCGNSDPDELPIVFATRLEEEKYRQLLAKQVNTPILTIAEFNKVMDAVRNIRFKGEYTPSLWDTCRAGKVSADIKAEQLSPKQVRLYENYLYADTAKYIRKDFAFVGGKWTYSITDTSTQVLTK